MSETDPDRLQAIRERWDEFDWSLRGSAVRGELAVKDIHALLIVIDQLTAERISDSWLPTPANINALPDPVRAYIHQLETNADPAVDQRNVIIAGDTIAQLQVAVAELTAERDAATNQCAEAEVAANDIELHCMSQPKAADARVKELESAQGWQPIETAPRDGARIIVPGTMAYYSSVWSRWVDMIDADGFTFLPPTHWMPLPQPPSEDGRG